MSRKRSRVRSPSTPLALHNDAAVAQWQSSRLVIGRLEVRILLAAFFNLCPAAQSDGRRSTKPVSCRFESCRGDFGQESGIGSQMRRSTVVITARRHRLINLPTDFRLLTPNTRPRPSYPNGRGSRLKPGQVQVRLLPTTLRMSHQATKGKSHESPSGSIAGRSIPLFRASRPTGRCLSCTQAMWVRFPPCPFGERRCRPSSHRATRAGKDAFTLMARWLVACSLPISERSSVARAPGLEPGGRRFKSCRSDCDGSRSGRGIGM